ncbi:sugar phosphate nucleotidyltransferase [Kitasatospora sp. NPDC056138]|uniref:sugar phosphate nucleotidyltransferase n=1 Tax=Kitasatospora sp. NPDC056138 TaxID=3345724 RepID=UPI0035DBE7AB
MHGVRGLIFAAGHGSRLRPLTETVPKPLLPVLNIPLLHWAVLRLKDAGITDIAINLQERHFDQFRSSVGSGERFGVEITYLHEKEPQGTGGTLRALTDYWGDSTLVAVDADIISTLDIAGLLEHHRSCEADATIGCLRHPWKSAEFTGDILDVDPGTSRVREYQHMPGEKAKGRIAATGTVVLEPSILDFVPEASDATAGPDPVDLGRDVLSRAAKESCRGLFAHVSPHRFVDFGTPEQFLAGSIMALHGRLGTPPDPHGRCDIRAAPGSATIAEDSSVEPPVLIGEGVTIGPGCRLTGPVVIGDASEIGAGAEIKSSVVLPGTQVPAGRRVHDAVIGNGIRLPDYLEEKA